MKDVAPGLRLALKILRDSERYCRRGRTMRPRADTVARLAWQHRRDGIALARHDVEDELAGAVAEPKREKR